MLAQWEPHPAVLDTHEAGWTCVADAAISNSGQLVAVTFSQQFCGIWAANLSQDKTAASALPAHFRGNDLADSSALKHHTNSSAAATLSSTAAGKHAAAIASATARVHIDDRLPGLRAFRLNFNTKFSF
jgi:hypothetical protein